MRFCNHTTKPYYSQGFNDFKTFVDKMVNHDIIKD